MAKLSIHTDEKKSKISRNIYGNFSEHLGRCIYNGIYVGENSDIPNVNGMRTDIVEALKAIKLPVLRWPMPIPSLAPCQLTALPAMISLSLSATRRPARSFAGVPISGAVAPSAPCYRRRSMPCLRSRRP